MIDNGSGRNSNLYRRHDIDASYQPMEGSVLSFHKAEWKVSDTGSAHWASSTDMSWLGRSEVRPLWGTSDVMNIYKSTNQKQEWPVATMFINESELN
jgi:hypothetical protein